MTSNAVTITIEGATQTGKSALAQALGEALNAVGFGVTVDDADPPRSADRLNTVLEAIAPLTSIKINVKRIPHDDVAVPEEARP